MRGKRKKREKKNDGTKSGIKSPEINSFLADGREVILNNVQKVKDYINTESIKIAIIVINYIRNTALERTVLDCLRSQAG